MGGKGVTVVEMARVKINWTGFLGGPGYSNLYFAGEPGGVIDGTIAQGAVDKVDAWLSSVQTRIPTTVTVQTAATVEVVDETNGHLLRFITVTPAAARTGQGTGNYSAASGAVCNWYTDGVRNSRRVRGRLFIVPLAGSALDTNGTINNTELTALRTITATLIDPVGNGDLGVWARPTAPGATDGIWHRVTAFTIPDKVAILTSRRD